MIQPPAPEPPTPQPPALHALKIDLHTHSHYSDGVLSPTALVERAAAAGVNILALTDHDSTAGLAEASRQADSLGLKLVPGVEISAAWRAQSIHVLGLWIDPCAVPLERALATQAQRRHQRMRNICSRLSEMGLPGESLLATVQAHPGLPTRSHLADAMVAMNLARSKADVFKNFLGKGRAAHLAADWPALDEVIGWILSSGGVASLAHPARYLLSAGARRQLIADFAAAGGTSLEVVTGGNAPQHIETCSALAVKFGLMGSVGSDFHDPQLSWNPLGRSLKLPDCITPVWRGYVSE